MSASTLKPLTLKTAKAQANALGYSLKRTQAGDFKLSTIGDTSPHGGYFTDSLSDAIDTAKAINAKDMARCSD